MKIEVLPRNEGFTVLFLNANPVTVAKIKGLSLALLSGMGYQFEGINVEEGDGFFFFNIVSTDEKLKLKLNDLFYSLDEATKEYIKGENRYS